MTAKSTTKEEAISIVQRLKKKLSADGYPIEKIFIFGSIAKESQHNDSDIDIAIVYTPFGKSRYEEKMKFAKARKGIDVRIEAVYLYPEELEHDWSTLIREIQKYGIEV